MTEKKWKPMLLSNEEYDLNDLDYSNMYISIKRDGVRAEIINGELKGRSLKSFKNPKLNEYFKNLTSTLSTKIILEGEIYCDGIPCREMAGICNSKDKDIPEGTKFYIFGIVDSEKTFEERIEEIKWIYHNQLNFHAFNFKIVEQSKCSSAEEAQANFEAYLMGGFEGAVLMDGSKKYKPGRVTIKQHIGFKLKPHKEEDLEIIGVKERFENTNESKKNELGESFKRNTVDAKRSTGIAACFTCKYGEGTTEVTITGTEEERRKIWENKEEYIGNYAIVKSMAYGAKDKPRHGRLIGIKDRCEK